MKKGQFELNYLTSFFVVSGKRSVKLIWGFFVKYFSYV